MRTFQPTAPSRRGSALMAVLWVVALLIVLVAGASMLVRQDVELDATRRQMFQARMLAESGVSLAMHPDLQPNDPLLFQQISPFEELWVEITGEDGLLNPNVLLLREDRDTWRRVLAYWGIADLPTADRIINNLLDWIDEDPFERSPGAEERSYGRPGFPFNRAFRSVEEMALVQGMELVEEVYPQWRDWFSVYATGVLDVNEAEPEIIAAVTGADLRLAQRLRSQRLGPDGLPHTEDDAPMPDVLTAVQSLGLGAGNPGQWASLLTISSATKRIRSRARVGDLEREMAVVSRGVPGQAGGASSILWMAER